MPSDITKSLTDLEPVTLSNADDPVDTSFADHFLKVFTRMAKAQMKTQQSAAFSADEVKKHLEEHGDLVEDLKAQRNKARNKNEQLTRFILEVVDLITNFRGAAEKSGNSEMLSAARTMNEALEKHMENIGLSIIPAIGEVPDSMYHFVLDVTSVDDPSRKDRIVEVVRNGYVYAGEIIRKADVIVGK